MQFAVLLLFQKRIYGVATFSHTIFTPVHFHHDTLFAVGPFQSDALLVPEHCLFDHIHDSKECKPYEDWNVTAAKSCVNRRMTLQSFAILQPCGIDRFNGVEFVCCPAEQGMFKQWLVLILFILILYAI